jgi:tRNA U54 and U55 pseudouridine synthase Pus10
MPENEHKIRLKVDKCGEQDCEDCQDCQDFVGSVEEVIDELNRRTFARDQVLIEYVIEHEKSIAALTGGLEEIAKMLGELIGSTPNAASILDKRFLN